MFLQFWNYMLQIAWLSEIDISRALSKNQISLDPQNTLSLSLEQVDSIVTAAPIFTITMSSALSFYDE